MSHRAIFGSAGEHVVIIRQLEHYPLSLQVFDLIR